MDRPQRNNFIEELRWILDTWGETPAGIHFEVMDKAAIPAFKALVAKMGVSVPREHEQLHGATTWDEFFRVLTDDFTTDYAFILRYDHDDISPRVIAVLERTDRSTARWIYLTGGVGVDQKELCAAELVDSQQRPKGIIRRLLVHAGIRFLDTTVQPGSAMERGTVAAGYKMEPGRDGQMRGTMYLGREDYNGCVHLDPIRIIPTRAGAGREAVRGENEGDFPVQDPNAGSGESLAGVDPGRVPPRSDVAGAGLGLPENLGIPGNLDGNVSRTQDPNADPDPGTANGDDLRAGEVRG